MKRACEHLEEVLRRERTDEAEGGGPRAECPGCEGAVASLEHARRVISAHEPDPPLPGVRRRLLEEVRDAGRSSSSSRVSGFSLAGGAAVGAAACLLLLVLLSTSDEESRLAEIPAQEVAGRQAEEPVAGSGEVLVERPRIGDGAALVVADTRRLYKGARLPEEVVDVVETSVLELRWADVEADDGARLRVSLEDERSEVLHLDRGEVRATARRRGPGDPFVVETRHGRVEVLGTRFTVLARSDTTFIAVESGVVRVSPVEGGPLRLVAGESVRLPLERIEQETADPSPRSDRKRAQAPARPTADDPSAEPSFDSTLEEARAAVETDPGRAAEIVTDILDEAREPAEEVAALAVLADAERRRGASSEAASLYRRVADHSAGAGFAEEALVQLALLRLGADEGSEALAVLGEARERFAGGVLGPERAALAARAHLEAGRPSEAAAELEALEPKDSTVEIQRLKLLSADALVGSEPKRAAGLARDVLRGAASDELERVARAILAQTGEGEQR